MPRGASKEREHEYDELVDDFKEEGRYEGREEEVAARIVNKQRAEYGETQGAKEKDRKGRSPDKNLPLEDYDHLTVDEITGKLRGMSRQQIEKVRDYERSHKDRKTLMEALNSRLSGR
jgi:hypothetical protein